jgi:hypothetical protein
MVQSSEGSNDSRLAETEQSVTASGTYLLDLRVA